MYARTNGKAKHWAKSECGILRNEKWKITPVNTLQTDDSVFIRLELLLLQLKLVLSLYLSHPSLSFRFISPFFSICLDRCHTIDDVCVLLLLHHTMKEKRFRSCVFVFCRENENKKINKIKHTLAPSNNVYNYNNHRINDNESIWCVFACFYEPGSFYAVCASIVRLVIRKNGVEEAQTTIY